MFEKVQARQAGFNNEASRMIPAGPDNKKARDKASNKHEGNSNVG
ncbi:hypothetical protein [Klebsiella variicola]